MGAIGVHLSPRETEILHEAALGRTTKEIAALLSIRERTVNWHFAKIFAKLGVANRTEAVAVALEQKLIPRPHHERGNTDDEPP
ncbi:MAG: helix-turn-helix transcriptional regulator [Chloroflexi bacterium]|nr:MAG: helix-turn-helix transcriptional regulator [Chloroflexota bacterium]